jgi:hypothetical protein
MEVSAQWFPIYLYCNLREKPGQNCQVFLVGAKGCAALMSVQHWRRTPVTRGGGGNGNCKVTLSDVGVSDKPLWPAGDTRATSMLSNLRRGALSYEHPFGSAV